MVKVSVIIPVYNVENYLNDCLNTIINQTLEDIEIICINDGSTDKSFEILKEYAANDKRIQLLSQENQGHAVATNKGIAMATGEYLFLMDSDDMLEVNALEDTYNIAEEKKVDFVLFKAINFDDEKNKYYESKDYNMEKLHEFVGEEIFNYEDINDLIFTIPVTPWNKLYNRQFIQEHNIKFPEGLIFDDNVFFWRVLFNAKKIYFYNEFLFKRRWYQTSSTTKGDIRFLDSIDIYNLIFDTFKEYNQFDKYKKILYRRKINTEFMRFNKIKDEYKEDYFRKMKEDFLNIFNNNNTYTEFIENTSFEFRKIFEEVIISNNSKELELLRLKYVNNNLYNERDRLKRENDYLKNINNDILNSKSWKITKFLR